MRSFYKLLSCSILFLHAVKDKKLHRSRFKKKKTTDGMLLHSNFILNTTVSVYSVIKQRAIFYIDCFVELARHLRMPDFASSVATLSWRQCLSGIRKSALQEQILAWRRARKADLRSRRQTLNLNRRDKPGMKLKDNADKDSNWSKLILKDSHC